MPTIRRVGLAWLVALSAVGCDSPSDIDVDLSAFERLPSIVSLDFARVAPAAEWDYWELRFSWGGADSDSIIGSGGRVARRELAASVVAQLDTLAPPSGFAIRCLPAYCFEFVAAVRGGAVATFASVQALRDFLGPVGSFEEAALLVHALGFYWDPGDPDTGYRATPHGWEFLVLELVRDCAPIQTDRVLLRVGGDARVTELDREVWERNERMCI